MDFLDTETWMGTMGMLFALALIGMCIWFVATMGKKGMDMQQTKMQTKHSGTQALEYRRLAEQATRAQAETAEQLKRLDAIETRLAEVERMLREVDEPVVAH